MNQSKPFRIAVLASTKGTDLQAIIDEVKAGTLPVDLACVISNKECYAIQRAKEQGYETFYINPKGKTREEFDREMAKILDDHGVQLIVLVGYMKILSNWFVKHFWRKIINVHPALIPKYCGPNFYGANVHEAVLANHEKETGMTIHYVDEICDHGEIILQKKCEVKPDDTPDTLKARVQGLEKKWYPEVIRKIVDSRKI
ncbi:MAG: phosphoribosylglycinamide formyltransferase, phosphoribosylglycinamide formyltransferase 1 [Candidatus Peregrinibacteria bacterium GW2011_GWF2_43_17]|nr:MAG: phosphoribosylglycinamide formyltransferase, phosphoribosylglycinamide formyltransferase 1 [Candidatus Peregrinibacteria bacterium GW2011_GWF2_43_17]KKT20652.1 MAG: Phosphoribosylglycinamide formyltransferase [Candidatus Peregrinibacteria bacterium GW2011_GWA2_43_8]